MCIYKYSDKLMGTDCSQFLFFFFLTLNRKRSELKQKSLGRSAKGRGRSHDHKKYEKIEACEQSKTNSTLYFDKASPAQHRLLTYLGYLLL